MNKDILEGNWKQLKGRIKVAWGRSPTMSWIKLRATATA